MYPYPFSTTDLRPFLPASWAWDLVSFALDHTTSVRQVQGGPGSLGFKEDGGIDSHPNRVWPVGAQGHETTKRRIAAMLACWDAKVKGTTWKPWNETEKDFRHPAIDHREAA